jgi:D-apionolactonase
MTTARLEASASAATRDRDRLVFAFGSIEPPTEPQPVAAGPVSATIVGGALRQIRFGAVELVRQIDFPIRDQDWVTLPPQVTLETLEETDGGFRYERRFEVADGALACRVVYQGSADGVVTATGEATARRDFVTNRSGFTLLHPLRGVVGRPVDVTSPSGAVRRATMPDLIAPAQPIKDIAGLAFDIEGVRLDIAFTGETFEMEDQRNWSDASFKTYCRPLVEPFAYTIAAGTTVRQEIRIKAAGRPSSRPAPKDQAVRFGPALSETTPEILLAAETGWLPDRDGACRLIDSGLKSLLLRVTAGAAVETLAEAQPWFEAGGAFDLEIALDDDAPAAPQLEGVARLSREFGVWPRHVVALPEAYLMSYQPNGVWPSGLSPRESWRALRAAFPGAQVGAGVLTNFTEFNRCRPDGVDSDYVTHGSSAIVHAADDGSVMQTLETMPDTFRSVRAIAGRTTYRLGLTAIGMRSNPYGASVSTNPDQLRLTMAMWDPRARGLFGAAWALGALAATLGQGVEAIALAAPFGPFGILARRSAIARPWHDNHPEAVAYPIFHVLRVLAGSGERLAIDGLSDGLVGVAAAAAGGRRLAIANLSRKTRSIVLAESGRAAILDSASCAAAAIDADWPANALHPTSAEPLPLEPLAILFFEPAS